jgi:hypothetical protein
MKTGWPVFVFFAATALSGCQQRSFEDQNTLASDALNTVIPGVDNGAATSPIEANVTNETAPASNWEYTSEKDPMTDRMSRHACVRSENEAQLDMPYEPNPMRLCLRDSPQYGRDAYVELLGDGQIMCQSYQACRVMVRFDDGQPRAFSAIGPADNSTNLVFIRDRSSFERAIRSADRTIIQIPFYQAGNQAIIFNTRGFAWPDAE